jgi:hypothetical protein
MLGANKLFTLNEIKFKNTLKYDITTNFGASHEQTDHDFTVDLLATSSCFYKRRRRQASDTKHHFVSIFCSSRLCACVMGKHEVEGECHPRNV